MRHLLFILMFILLSNTAYGYLPPPPEYTCCLYFMNGTLDQQIGQRANNYCMILNQRCRFETMDDSREDFCNMTLQECHDYFVKHDDCTIINLSQDYCNDVILAEENSEDLNIIVIISLGLMWVGVFILCLLLTVFLIIGLSTKSWAEKKPPGLKSRLFLAMILSLVITILLSFLYLNVIFIFGFIWLYPIILGICSLISLILSIIYIMKFKERLLPFLTIIVAICAPLILPGITFFLLIIVGFFFE